MTTADFLVPTGAALGFSIALMGLIKPYLEASVLPQSSPLHDNTLRLLTILIAIVVALIAHALLRSLTPDAAFLVVAQGIVSGLSAIGLYHVTTTG